MSSHKSFFLSLILLFSISFTFCSPGEREATAPKTDCEVILGSLSKLEDFQFRDSISVYLPENLHYYLDGGAEFYLNNGFVKLATSLVASKKTDQDITVEVYRVQKPSQADFIYRTERGDSPDNFPIGDKGYRSDGYMQFVKGVFLVKLLAYDATEAQLEASVALAKFLEASIQP
ncbi:MAG: hypothetical protein AMJ41_05150 [candidate division Zixibacteria bacterium DG_27]|nr:MAG: hypothetical protein AMJ41_05150 [candidate division Zixibacteria bacterium DG_27]